MEFLSFQEEEPFHFRILMSHCTVSKEFCLHYLFFAAIEKNLDFLEQSMDI